MMPLSLEVETVRHVYAVNLIQSRWRAFIHRRRRTIQLFQGSEKRTLRVRAIESHVKKLLILCVSRIPHILF